MERRYSSDELRRLAIVRKELAILSGAEPKPSIISTEFSRAPVREVIIFERNPSTHREIPQRQALDEGEQFSPTFRSKNERRG